MAEKYVRRVYPRRQITLPKKWVERTGATRVVIEDRGKNSLVLRRLKI